MNYTPGPWEWTEYIYRGGKGGIVGKDGAEVLFPNHCNDGDDGDAWFDESPNEADRKLIIAAPALVEACKAALEALEPWEDDERPSQLAETLRVALEKAGALE